MAIATSLGWSNLATVVLSIALAFVFGYTLTSIPLARSGMTVAAIVAIALAADTVSIAIMEAIDNGFVLAVPGSIKPDWAMPWFGGRYWEGSPWRSPGLLGQPGEHPAGQRLLPSCTRVATGKTPFKPYPPEYRAGDPPD
jgi:Domain of unknown function (DUF4396)